MEAVVTSIQYNDVVLPGLLNRRYTLAKDRLLLQCLTFLEKVSTDLTYLKT